MVVRSGPEVPLVTSSDTEALDAFVRVAHRVVWAAVATVDRRGRPRSRVLHPYWQRTPDGLVGWVFTRPTPLKLAHLAAAPFASCTYWDPGAYETAVAECDAALVGDAATRRLVWDLFAQAPQPLGYDPRILGVDGPLDEAIVVLRLEPWRLSTGGALPTAPRHGWVRPAAA
ncbi:pyridoxamine 5'-phosphate oxidase family protein [Pseudonocardia humida]|uniref:Pyridoxamine 5'-phosphate oxidase family protein n=1 Tax=Pseudonocardia humida TaxID=2800819 RepID=A0ABT1ABR1_9PSEU|nr:pyridoxamine 5'-phosphate oxidase family protein [Pseudonocardia humida]MCO1660366.1 pyridoxamine 5'-phosphate oxidase family protein [Pseudonocardia humida]